jgi:hypothetical protein
MPLKWGSETAPDVRGSTDIDTHNARVLQGIDRALYATFGVLAFATILFIVAVAVVIVGVFR